MEVSEVDVAFADSSRMAEAAGLELTSFRVALTRSKKRRTEGRSLDTDIPAPDLFIGRSPVWGLAKMEQWLKSRAEAESSRAANREEG